MRTVAQVYEQYEVMPQLATHMLRVAGVGKLVTDDWGDRELADKCVKACLLHDLGNLAKFKLASEYQREWGPRQKRLWVKWGRDAHEATYGMLKELGLPEYVEYLLAEARLYESEPTENDFMIVPKPALIVLYADLRVVPTGVVTLQERVEDLTKRYSGFRAESRWGQSLEDYVQTLTTVNVQAITESAVTPLFDELLTVTV